MAAASEIPTSGIIQDGTAPESLTEKCLAAICIPAGAADPDLIPFVPVASGLATSSSASLRRVRRTDADLSLDFTRSERQAFVRFGRRERRFGRVLNK